MDCPIKMQQRKLFQKENKIAKKIKDTHILCLIPEKLNLINLRELISNELKITIRPHNQNLAE